MSRTSGRTMTKRCSRGKKTSAAPGRVLLNVTANVSGGCGDFICSVVPAHSEHAACTPSRCSFRKTSLETMSATRERRSPHCTLTLGIAPSRRRARPAQVSILNSTLAFVFTRGLLTHRYVASAFLFPLLHNVPDQRGNFICSRIEREMARIENVDFGLRHILTVAFRFAGVEREIILAPDHQ